MRTSVQERARKLLKVIEQEVKANRLVLPSLPSVAIRVRGLASNMHCPVNDLCAAIATDAAIAARLIKVANSSAYRRGHPVTSLRQAVNTLGYKLVRSLVTQLAILQTMHASKDTARLHGFVASSMHVSALCRCIASKQPHLDAELGALAGLLHDIGKLPLRDFLLTQQQFSQWERLRLELVLHPYVGAMLLKHWGMADELVQAARWHEAVMRETGKQQADYVDVVIAANLTHYGLDKGRYVNYTYQDVPAVHKCFSSDYSVLCSDVIEQRMLLVQQLAS